LVCCLSLGRPLRTRAYHRPLELLYLAVENTTSVTSMVRATALLRNAAQAGKPKPMSADHTLYHHEPTVRIRATLTQIHSRSTCPLPSIRRDRPHVLNESMLTLRDSGRSSGMQSLVSSRFQVGNHGHGAQSYSSQSRDLIRSANPSYEPLPSTWI
jgi:hypothetical protein